MGEWLILIGNIILIVIIETLVKLRNSSDKYFEEKAKNFATKQDVISITAKTETVQAEFHKILGQFDADLKFKYQYYEKQYESLYSKLYQKICESEGNRFSIILREEKLNFDECPIVEYEPDYVSLAVGEHNTESGLLDAIVDLISEYHMYASPELVKQVCALKAMEKCFKSTFDVNNGSSAERIIKINIVKTILRDYYWLRKQLHLEGGDDDIKKLEKGDFILSL